MKQRLLFKDRKEQLKQIGKTITVIFKVWLAMVGVVSFGAFICEESAQVAMFSTWAAKNAKDWGMVKKGCEAVNRSNNILKSINRSLGLLNPIGFISYESYADSTDIYIASLRVEIFAHEPELFEGEQIEFSFKPQSVKKINNKFYYENNKITVITNKELPLGISTLIHGIVEIREGKVIVE